MNIGDVLIFLVFLNQFWILFLLNKILKQNDLSKEDSSVKAMAVEVQKALKKLPQKEK